MIKAVSPQRSCKTLAELTKSTCKQSIAIWKNKGSRNCGPEKN